MKLTKQTTAREIIESGIKLTYKNGGVYHENEKVY